MAGERRGGGWGAGCFLDGWLGVGDSLRRTSSVYVRSGGEKKTRAYLFYLAVAPCNIL